jgi:hypothetical protein
MGKEEPMATSWVTITSPKKDDVATRDWMKSPKMVLNNGIEAMFLHYFIVLKNISYGL